MPGLTRRSSSLESSSTLESENSGEYFVVNDDQYAANLLNGSAEKPLSEQLEPIAVIGMGCRLPGNVSSPSQFWKLMIEKGTGRTPKVPSSRFNIDAHLHSNNERPGSFNVPGGYFLDSGLREFDPALFNISPIEAMWMDPQQRKLLEVVYEAMESAGIPINQIENTKTAVFVGSFTSDFQQMSFKEPDFRHSYAATGVDPGIISNRISHVFNLSGPSITVNTACSSSIYAMHNACNALRNNECCAAFVGGTNLVLTVDQHMNTAKLGVLSPDSTCHTFDAAANGYGRADGVGAVYLKRLSDAVRDGDPIRGVLRSSAVNSNGKVHGVGITYPNREGQVEVIRHAYRRGGDMDPRLTGYFECHGTGTPVGDPIEVNAVALAMNKAESQETSDIPTEKLWIGAVKTNIGHSEAASGLSAIIKAILVVENGIIPPTRGLVNPNPNIDWDGWRVQVPSTPQPFPAHLPIRRVSVNSFGYGGTNGHFIVEGVQSLVDGYKHGQKKVKGCDRGFFNQKRPYLIPFSAHDRPTLLRNIEAHKEAVKDYSLLDLTYTLANRRSKLASRGFLVSSPDAVLDAFTNISAHFLFAEKQKRPTVGFVFTGQGAQWPRMGRELMQYYPSFLYTIRKLDRVLGELINGPMWTVEDSLLAEASESRINEAEFSQPLCTAIQIALVDLLRCWGITPKVTVGHSSGEIAAAYAAGLISFNDSIVAAYYRGRAVKDINTNGSMMAVGLGAEAVQSYLSGVQNKVVVACHNSPALVTLSGDADAVESVKDRLTADGVFARLVKTGGKAYHSFHMKPAAAAYHDLMVASKSHKDYSGRLATDTVMVSSVTNTILDQSKPLNEDYWCANLISPVKFNQAIQTIGTSPDLKDVDLLIEVGPHAALMGPIKQICREHKLNHLSYLPTLERNGNSATQLLTLAGQLFLKNFELDFARVSAIEQTSAYGKNQLLRGKLLVDLPPYQWNYAKDLWAEPRQSTEHRRPQYPRHDVLGSRLPGGSRNEPSWRNCLRIRDLPWLKDHSLGGEVVFPAAGYFSMAIEAVTQMNSSSQTEVEILDYTLHDVSIKTALVVPDDNDGIETLFTLQPSVYTDTDGLAWWNFNVSSCSIDGHWNSHMSGTIGINAQSSRSAPKAVPTLTQRATGKAWNQALKSVGFDYGPSFQDMDDVRSDGKRYIASASSTLKQDCGMVEGESRYIIHPSTIDSCLQLIIVSIYAGRMQDMTCGAVPIQVDEVAIWPPTKSQLQDPKAYAYSWTDERGFRSFNSGTQLLGSDGRLLMSMERLRSVAYEAAVPQNHGTVIKEQPFTELAWDIDIDTLTTDSPIAHLTTRDLVALMCFKYPGVHVLEIGSTEVLAILETESLMKYTVTTQSQQELEALAPEISKISQADALLVDISQDLESQGLQEGKYNVIIPGKGGDTSHFQRLLASDGCMIVDQSICESLKEDFAIRHLPNGLAIATIKDASKKEPAVGKNTQSIAIVYRKRAAEICDELIRLTGQLGTPRFVQLSEAEFSPLEHVVVACDIEEPLLLTMEADELAALRRMVSAVSSVLWLSAGALLSGSHPQHAMASGLARSLSSEMASLDFTTLDFDLSNVSVELASKQAAMILQMQMNHDRSKESEYCSQEGLLHISRLITSNALNNEYGLQSSKPKPMPFNSSDRLVGLKKASKLVFEHDKRAEQPLGSLEVQVRTLMTTLNKEDVLVRNGADYPTTFSHEIYGVVTQVGSGVAELEAGNKVFGFNFDRLATYQIVSADMVQKVQPSDNPEELVTLPMAYATAHHGLHSLARLEKEDIVLVLHGTGSAGAAAITLSKYAGAMTYVAVKDDAEASRVASAFDLPAENIIPHLEYNVMARLKTLTRGRAADIVFSSSYVSPTVARGCWREIAPFGRFIETGRKNVLRRGALDTVPTNRGASYMAFDTLDLYKRKPHLLSRYIRHIAHMYRSGNIPITVSIQKKNISDYDRAVANFNDDFAGPKTVIEFTESSATIEVLPRRAELSLSPNATYFLVGCLGGLGRSLTSWMVSRGARRFAFMSRSGADKAEAADLVRDLEVMGIACQILKGDVASKEDVDAALAQIPANYPVRGVVHAAMVLRDGLFHSMGYDNWRTSIAPKVLGALNLHQALSDTDLDFFVCTSSTSGILGTPGQANYAAGNSFLDSLARHRVANGQRASSLVLPMVQNIGVVAENPEIEAALRRKGIYGIDESHLLDAFEAAIMTQSASVPSDHIIVGLDPSKLKESLSSDDVTDAFWTEDARFRIIMQTVNSADSSGKGGASVTILKAIKGAESVQKAEAMITEHFTTKLERLLLLEREVLESGDQPIVEYGLDSMIGAELRNWIFKEYALDIPFQQLLGPSLTIAKLANLVCAGQGLV